MDKLLATFLIVISTACGAGTVAETYTPRPQSKPCTVSALASSIDPELVSYVTEFASDAQRYQASCFRVRNIQFADKLDDSVAGFCRFRFTVTISKEFWTWASDIERRTLVYHELGHCALNYDHASESDTNNIMNPYVLPESIAQKNWDKLVETLFTKGVPK